MYTELRRYENKEFCKDMQCQMLHRSSVDKNEFFCERNTKGCVYTAKEFHHWLNENGFHLLKPTGR
mgnify:CR=1 FL=1